MLLIEISFILRTNHRKKCVGRLDCRINLNNRTGSNAAMRSGSQAYSSEYYNNVSNEP